jgi:hypothetical protein
MVGDDFGVGVSTNAGTGCCTGKPRRGHTGIAVDAERAGLCIDMDTEGDIRCGCGDSGAGNADALTGVGYGSVKIRLPYLEKSVNLHYIR